MDFWRIKNIKTLFKKLNSYFKILNHQIKNKMRALAMECALSREKEIERGEKFDQQPVR